MEKTRTPETNGRVHILVVDDEEGIRDILQRSIREAGYRCSAAGNAEEAFRVLESGPVDVVITDVVMPGLGGMELMEAVKKNHGADVIVMTGFAEDLRYEEVIERGACDFIRKPFTPGELLVRLRRSLRERFILAERNRAEQELKLSLDKIRRVLEETVNALASALEKRDPYTAGHQQRVARLACEIAREIGLSEKQVEGIRIAGYLHDIGKISVPTDILNKPGKLSGNELKIVMEHPQTGYDILKDIEFDQPVALIVLQHHELMDGSGYPRGISDGDIILEARILTVADVVEAVSSHRPYRPALGREKALKEISRNKGILYDRIVVETCIKLMNERGFTLI